jgi:hypothetical protein
MVFVKTKFAASALSLATVFSQSSLAQNTKNELRLEQRDGCELMIDPVCKGKRTTLNYYTKAGRHLALEQMQETNNLTYYNKTLEHPDVGAAHVEASRSVKVKALTLSADQRFDGRYLGMSMGIYLGQISGVARAREYASLDTKAVTFTTPSYTTPVIPSQNVSVPATHAISRPEQTITIPHTGGQTITVPAINIPAYHAPSVTTPEMGPYTIPSTTLSIPAQHAEIYDQQDEEKTSAYGGLRLTAQAYLPVNEKTRVLVGGFGNMGVDRKNYGTQLGVVYTPSGGVDDLKTPHGDWRKNSLMTEAPQGWTLFAGMQVRKISKDPFYDVLTSGSNSLAARYNGHLDYYAQRANDIVDRETDGKIAAGVTASHITGQRILDILKIPNPYVPQKSLHLSATWKRGDFSASVSRTEPVGQARQLFKPSTNIALGYQF